MDAHTFILIHIMFTNSYPIWTLFTFRKVILALGPKYKKKNTQANRHTANYMLELNKKKRLLPPQHIYIKVHFVQAHSLIYSQSFRRRTAFMYVVYNCILSHSFCWGKSPRNKRTFSENNVCTSFPLLCIVCLYYCVWVCMCVWHCVTNKCGAHLNYRHIFVCLINIIL